MLIQVFKVIISKKESLLGIYDMNIYRKSIVCTGTSKLDI